MEKSPRNIVFAAALVGMLVAIAIFARPAYRLVRTARAERLAAEAEAAIAQAAWPEALQKAQAAYHLDPTSARCIRVVARLYTIAGQPSAFAFWENLRATGQAASADRRELVRAGMRFGKAASVRDEALKLAADKPLQAENLRLAAEFSLFVADKTNALRFSRELVKLDPSSAAELALSKSLLASGEILDQAQARAILQRLSMETNAAGLEAQVVMARSGLVSDEKLPELIQRLSKHPARQLPHRLLAEELKLRLRPQDRATTVETFVKEFSGSSVTNRVEVARWLNRQHEPGRVVEMINTQDAHENRDAFLARIDALASLAEWKQARGELEAEGAPIEPALRELFLARTARELHLLPEAEAHWRRVQLELTTQPEAVRYVAEYAEQIGEADEARKAYERLVGSPEFSEQAFAGLIRLAEQNGGTRTLREIMRDLSARRPDDPAPQNDFAYLNLLLNERLEASRTTALKLYEGNSNVMAFRTTLALAHLRVGEIEDAAKLYAGLNLNWQLLQPGWQAVHAAVVAAAGETNFARTLARQIPVARLKPEEKILVQPWL